MDIYNIALAFMRVLATTQFIQALVTLVFSSIRIGVALSASDRFLPRHFLVATELSQLTIPLEEAVWAVAFLVLAKPIARFASRPAPEPTRAAVNNATERQPDSTGSGA